MSSLEKIIQIERTIGIYQNSDDEVVEEIVISIPIETLREIVPPNADDPDLYEGYVLTEEQLSKLNAHLEKKITPDFTTFYYVLEATGIYDWSAN